MVEKKESLKLFIVGESSTDSEKWGYGSRAVVIARSPEEANGLLAERGSSIFVEVDLANETPKVLMHESCHGEF